ncbi:Crp/Fnr family transcriptional regulator [Sphingobacterium griseoflavum]|uniref:cAMP-binding protein n=1 Tax=Sphingobacterium griseoflavum TaxID=1474952 RepID=A0ABQ3I1U7_9SPHI|nr:Crp/Fnr family transcriptional regulator [Sphingobacterium griseoflavum]GHE45659.1 cAMP-binding protein [Sphingobacterium griseoflavum]
MFLNHITEKFAHFNLSEAEIGALRKILHLEHFKKNSFFIKKGEYSNRIGLLIKGLLYAYDRDSNEEEQIHSFFFAASQHDVVFNYEAYIRNVPSAVSYKCYQDVTMIVLDTVKVKELYEQFPRFYQLEMLIMQPQFLQALYRSKMLHASSAPEKISLLKAQTPELFKLFPSAYIASYLGIHRNTFNRAMHKL